MKDYKYDYNKNSFKTYGNKEHRQYYIKVNKEYVEVSEGRQAMKAGGA